MSKRSNQEWVEELRGDRGSQAQSLAYEALGGYLYTVAYNYLLTRQAKGNPQILVGFAPLELAALAQDFVQETLEKLAKHDFALLDRFRGQGYFTSWVAVIVRRQAAMELRKAYWDRQEALPPLKGKDDESLSPFDLISEAKEPSWENRVMEQEVREALQGCLGRLKPDQRVALVGLIVEGKSGKELAEFLDRPSENSVFMLISRTKRKLRKCLQKAGWERDVLEIFVESNE